MNNKLIAVLLFSLSLFSASAYASTAAELDATCTKSAGVAKAMRKDKHTGQYVFAKTDADGAAASYDAGQCAGYIEGLMEALDGVVMPFSGGKAYRVKINYADIKEWDVAKTLHSHLQATPLDASKRADVVLFEILREHNLVQGDEYIQQVSITKEQ